MEAPSHSVAFAPLLTQAWGEDEGEDIYNADSHDTPKVGAGDDDDPFKFEIDGDGDEGLVGENENDDDSFALMTQQNDRFKDDDNDINGAADDDGTDTDRAGDEDDSEGSCSSISSDGEDDSGSDSDSSSCVESTPLQERRARKIRRNDDFWAKYDVDCKAEFGEEKQQSIKQQPIEQQEPSSSEEDDPKLGVERHAAAVDVGKDGELGTAPKKQKKRGMLFTKPSSSSTNKRPKSIYNMPLTTKSLVDELIPNYPHRTNQIHILCSQLATTIQKTKFAWQIRTNNVRSNMGNTQYSEASYQGNIKLAAPSPILVTGPGGVGKTSIVCDVMSALQNRIKKEGELCGICYAFVDCASSESGSVAAVMNSAYRQLYECYHTSVFRATSVVDEKYTTGTNKGGKHNKLGGDVLFHQEDSDESHNEDDGLDAAEDLIERARKRGKAGKKAKSGKANKKAAAIISHGNNNVRQTRSTLATNAASKPTPEKPCGLTGSTVHIANKNTQNSGSVALFGRATSALLQGGISNNYHAAKSSSSQSNNNWRCAFLVLDNADRILSWKKPGSINPLTQLLMLPSAMGINLTIMFISRSTIFQYSSVHKSQATILDAVHPLKIHLGSYTSVEMIKSILQVQHVQQSIIGQSTSAGKKYSCTSDVNLRSKLNDVLYTSMLNSFVPTIKSTTQDITEIMRLGRLLWPQYVAPVEKSADGKIDDSLRTLMIQMLLELRRDTADGPCHNSNCSFCRFILHSNGYANNADINTLKQRLSEKLDRGIRESMRSLLSNTAMMPGRVLQLQNIEPYAKRLPYTTKFLLLAAFLCQNKRPEQDMNLFTTKNTGKAKRKRKDEGLAYVSSSKDMKQRQPSFPLERLLSVFYSIIGQYGQHFMVYKETNINNVAQLGTERLFQSISQLITTGILCSIGSSVKLNEKFGQDLMEVASAKFMCTISRADARVIATSVNFPLEKYCP